jgi:hypothetical protein
MASAIAKCPFTVTIRPWWRISEGAACATAADNKSGAMNLAAKNENKPPGETSGRE